MSYADLERRARLYTADRNRTIAPALLGDGTDGRVWKTDKKTAIKVFERQQNFETELACYQLLKERGVYEIQGYAIPRLLDYSREWMVIEMEIVEPPYILDFGKAYFKRQRPQFSPEVMRETRAAQIELWGDYWPEIRSILAKLEALGIYHTDPKPGNIRPANWDPPID
jgi:hypothetical protein